MPINKNHPPIAAFCETFISQFDKLQKQDKDAAKKLVWLFLCGETDLSEYPNGVHHMIKAICANWLHEAGEDFAYKDLSLIVAVCFSSCPELGIPGCNYDLPKEALARQFVWYEVIVNQASNTLSSMLNACRDEMLKKHKKRGPKK